MSGAPLALSLGDPAGVGPEIAVKAWRAMREGGPSFLVVGDAASLEREGAPVARIAAAGEAATAFASALPTIDLPLGFVTTPGAPSAAAAAAVIGWIETAARLALDREAAALVTGPIAKHALYGAGFRFPGHTEFLGALAPAAKGAPAGPVMMLVAGDFRASLATIHEPLARVAGLVSFERIVEVGAVTDAALRGDFGIARPRLALAALNPHAGEAGALGREEIETLAPAAAALRGRGVDIVGPVPADTLFHPEARARYDAAVCLYHDQALIPAKMLDFWGGVNVTLGLSIVRTSPDHGVALNIAGKGVARPESLIAALRLAAEIAARRRLG